MELRYVVKNNKYNNINQILKNEFELSSRLLLKLIKNKKVFLNGFPTDTRNLVKNGDIITILLDMVEDNSNIVPAKINLDVVYEDDGILIVNKPSGIPVHPSILHYEDSLSNGVRYYFDQIGLKKKIRPVNRLDKDTTGLVIFAKNEYIQECLIKQMTKKIFQKEYLCIVSGKLKEKIGTVDAPIARKQNSIIERCISSNGQKAVTHYKVIKEFDDYSLVRCLLETGRTHQIRVHFAYIGHPLLGDELYGNKSNLINRQALHCNRLTFINPFTKKEITIKTDYPDDFLKLITT